MNPFTLINENSITLNNLNDQDQDFKNLFNIKNSIIYSGCSKMNIKFDSGINKLIIENSKNLKFEVNKIISGIDIKNSDNIFIYTSKDLPIYSLYFENCNQIEIKINRKFVNKTKILIETCKDINFFDYNNKKIDSSDFINI